MAPQLPELEILERIGAGGYGEMWLARSTATGVQRAVKIVYRATFADERPFNREFEGIRKFERISHSHSCHLALFQVGKNDAEGYFYYAMELADPVPGAGSYRPLTLRTQLEQGRVPAARVLELALALTEAVAELHRHGLIHRDVKPSNIIFVDGRPKLADIGLVSDLDDTRSIVGTEGYLPNEGPGTQSADLFALGKVLYEALTGLDRRHFPELPADMRSWSDAVLAFELNAILAKACATIVGERYRNAGGMLEELKLLDAGKSIRRQRSVQRCLNWTWKTVAAAMAMVGVLWLLYRRPAGSPTFTLANSTFQSSGTTNVEAWQAWRRAFQMGNTYSAAGLSNAVVEYERATQLDPNYLGAWSTRSIVLSIAVDNGYLPAQPALTEAKRCAETALRLNPRSGPPRCSLAFCTLPMDYDFPKAERLLREAISLAPANYTLRGNFAHFLVYLGRFEEAEAMHRKVISEQPSEGGPHADLGLIRAAQGRFAEARASCDDSIRLDPARPAFYLNRAGVLWMMNEREAAALDFLRFVELSGFVCLNPGSDASELREALAQGGPERLMERLIALLESRKAAGQFVSEFDLARLHALAGHRAQALDYLEKALDEHRMNVLGTKVHFAFRDLHDEPRFHAVLRRLNLEQ